MTAALLALLLAADAPVALRADRPPMTQAQAGTMTPAALADALLASGHPAIVERELLPSAAGPTASRLDVRLVAAAAVDPRSGFCVKPSWRVTAAKGRAPRLIAEPPVYRLRGEDPTCEEARVFFFRIAPRDRDRGLTVVRLVDEAERAPASVTVPVTFDDAEGREDAHYCHERATACWLAGPTITDARAALAAVGARPIRTVAPLIDPAFVAGRGTAREAWRLTVEFDWTVDVLLDHDRLAAMRLRRSVP